MDRTSPSARVLVALCCAAFASVAFAQSPPQGAQPLPDIPPPPKLSTAPTADDPDVPSVTIREAAEGKVEEFRTKDGRIYAVRVTPKVGKPYLLVDPDGKGELKAGEIGSGVKPAQWTLFEF